MFKKMHVEKIPKSKQQPFFKDKGADAWLKIERQLRYATDRYPGKHSG
jgi:hypothetical protein